MAAQDIEFYLYPEFLRERGWPAQPLRTVFRHLKELTSRREKDVDPGARTVWRRLTLDDHYPRTTRTRRQMQVQYQVPAPAAAVVDIEAARRRA